MLDAIDIDFVANFNGCGAVVVFLQGFRQRQ
jgi:hypothetical protein